jgi:hypothetical protein
MILYYGSWKPYYHTSSYYITLYTILYYITIVKALVFLGVFAAYTMFQRATSDGSGSSASGGPPPNRRFGGGANIRGVSDLPPDPKGG